MVNSVLNWKTAIQAILSLTIAGWVTPAWSNSKAIHTLINFQGNVQVQKAQWTQFHHAEFGDSLNSNDQIKLGNNASVTIYCSNLNQWTVTQPGTHQVSQGCPAGEAIIRLSPEDNNGTRRRTVSKEERLQQLPYLISPRHTLVFNDSLTLRWNGVSGATHYKVMVGWQEPRRINGTQMVYDGELKPGEVYSVSVVAYNGVNPVTNVNNWESFDSWFIVVEEEKARALREQVAVIQQQELNEEQEALILAHLYRGNEFNAEAIRVLEALVDSGSQTITIYRVLGDIYQQIGLSLMAKEVYGQGLALTAAEENSEVKARMQWGLGEVEYTLGNQEKAVEWLEKAKASYSAFGEERQVEALAKRINFVLGIGQRSR